MEQEKKIWEGVREQKEGSLKILYFRYYDALYKYGIQKIGDRVQVCSIINIVFAGIWEKGNALPQVDNVGGYLFITFKRQVFHFLNKKNRIKLDLLPEEQMEPLMDINISYERWIIEAQEEKQTKQKIAAALRKLTPRQKELVVLKYFKECTTGEIALQLKISTRTIYNTLHSAMAILRKELESDQ